MPTHFFAMFCLAVKTDSTYLETEHGPLLGGGWGRLSGLSMGVVCLVRQLSLALSDILKSGH